MRSLLAVLLAPLSALWFTGCSQATALDKDPELSVDDIVAKHLEAIGGVEAHKKLTTRKIEGSISIVNIGGPWKTTITQKAPDKKHTHIVIPDHGVVTEAVGGTLAWKKEPGQAVRKLAGSELHDKLRDARFYSSIEMMQEGQFSYEKRLKIKGNIYHVLNGTFKDDSAYRGMKVTVHIDAQSYLSRTLKIPLGEDLELAIEVEDYRPVDGIQIPFSIDILIGGNQAVKLKFDKVTHGIKVEDALFTMPEG